MNSEYFKKLIELAKEMQTVDKNNTFVFHAKLNYLIGYILALEGLEPKDE